jgi:hypothetical protein
MPIFATADGVPVLRVMQLFHKVKQERVAGNDLLPACVGTKAAESRCLRLSVRLFRKKFSNSSWTERQGTTNCGLRAVVPPVRALGQYGFRGRCRAHQHLRCRDRHGGAGLPQAREVDGRHERKGGWGDARGRGGVSCFMRASTNVRPSGCATYRWNGCIVFGWNQAQADGALCGDQ